MPSATRATGNGQRLAAARNASTNPLSTRSGG